MVQSITAGGIIKRAENKWEYDLISEETGNKDPQEIKKIAKDYSFLVTLGYKVQ